MMRPMVSYKLLSRLPRATASLLRALGNLADESGVSLYLVGGVVRDLLLKRENWDLDLTVEGDGIAFARLVAVQYRAGLAVFERFATARLTFPDGLKTKTQPLLEPDRSEDASGIVLKTSRMQRTDCARTKIGLPSIGIEHTTELLRIESYR